MYDFKRKIENQSKNLAETERKIVSLSGSTNAADIAERRRLQATLLDQQRDMEDSYREHSLQSQEDALDKEAQAYEENMTRFVEGLRTSLETATANMDEFLMGVTSMVMYNADTVLAKYEETNLPLTTELTNPWIKAKEAVGTYSGDALALMNQWTKEGGFFAQFNASGTTNLTSPWSAGTNAANVFKSSVETAMTGVVSNINSNVQTASSALSKLYQQIKDTEARAASANIEATDSSLNIPKFSGSKWEKAPVALTEAKQVDNKILSKYKLTSDQVLALGYGPITLEKFEELLKNYQIKYSAIYKQVANTRADERTLKRIIYGEYVSGPWAVRQYAKGTSGVNKDQFAIIDELGEELILHANPTTGRLEYLTKGSGVVPSDLTSELMELGKIGVDGLVDMNKFGANVNMISNAVTKPNYEFNFDSLVHVDTVDSDTLPKLEKMVDQKIDTFAKQLNYSIKKFSR